MYGPYYWYMDIEWLDVGLNFSEGCTSGWNILKIKNSHKYKLVPVRN
jgi:hypothetical protein